MSSVPIVLLLQFHGRFVFAENTAEHSLTVFAVDPRQVVGLVSDPHDPILTIREANVDRNGPDGKDAKAPARRFVSTSPTAFDGTHLLWDIVNCQIDVPTGGNFKWLDTGDLMPIADLASGTTRPFNRKLLDQTPAPPITALVTIHSGLGFGFHELGKDLAFFDYDYVRYDDHDETKIKDAGRLADMVAIAIRIPEPHVDISFGPNEGIRVCADSLLKKLRIAQIFGQDVRGVILNFSNLCTAAESRRVDKEFAAFYEVLDTPPPIEERLIPKVNLPKSAGSGGGYGIEEIGHPFGDCYLSAKVSF